MSCPRLYGDRLASYNVVVRSKFTIPGTALAGRPGIHQWFYPGVQSAATVGLLELPVRRQHFRGFREVNIPSA